MIDLSYGHIELSLGNFVEKLDNNLTASGNEVKKGLLGQTGLDVKNPLGNIFDSIQYLFPELLHLKHSLSDHVQIGLGFDPLVRVEGFALLMNSFALQKALLDFALRQMEVPLNDLLNDFLILDEFVRG